MHPKGCYMYDQLKEHTHHGFIVTIYFDQLSMPERVQSKVLFCHFMTNEIAQSLHLRTPMLKAKRHSYVNEVIIIPVNSHNQVDQCASS